MPDYVPPDSPTSIPGKLINTIANPCNGLRLEPTLTYSAAAFPRNGVCGGWISRRRARNPPTRDLDVTLGVSSSFINRGQQPCGDTDTFPS